MITIFHGDSVPASRRAFQAALAREAARPPSPEVVRLDGASLLKPDLIAALESVSLFPGGRVVVIDGLLSRRQSADRTALIELVRAKHQSAVVYLIESRAIPAGTLKKFSGRRDVKILEFKPDKTLFRFLGALRPGGGARVIDAFHQTLATEPPGLLLFWIARRSTQLLLVASGAAGGLKGWQREQLERQSKFWTREQLLKLHSRVLAIDEAAKNGSSPIGLATELDILLARL